MLVHSRRRRRVGSWTYAVVANNMEIEQMFIEPGLNDTGNDDDPYIETNPDNILEFLK